jgi:hypothetical protein
MCEELIARIKHSHYGHVIDQPGILKEYEKCGRCGKVKHTSNLGQTTKRDPNCVDHGL